MHIKVSLARISYDAKYILMVGGMSSMSFLTVLDKLWSGGIDVSKSNGRLISFQFISISFDPQCL